MHNDAEEKLEELLNQEEKFGMSGCTHWKLKE